MSKYLILLMFAREIRVDESSGQHNPFTTGSASVQVWPIWTKDTKLPVWFCPLLRLIT